MTAKKPIEKHSMPSAESRALQPSDESLRVICKWVAIFAEHFRKEISDLAMVGFTEGLSDLRAPQIERACRLTLHEAKFMPTVADIRERLYDTPVSEDLEYLDEEPMSDEARTEALYFSEKLKATLVEMESEPSPHPSPVFAPVTSAKFNINHEAYLAWLQEQEIKDDAARKAGMSPEPRSKEELLAMFYRLSLNERRRLRKKAEWTKQLTKNT